MYIFVNSVKCIYEYALFIFFIDILLLAYIRDYPIIYL